MRRVGDEDHLIVERDQKISGIGLISGAGTRFETPERISNEGSFENVHVGGCGNAMRLYNFDPGRV